MSPLSLPLPRSLPISLPIPSVIPRTLSLRPARATAGTTGLAHTRHAAHASAPADALPIVLIHGLCGTQQHWDPVVEPLREFGDVVTLDLPGFGATPAPMRWTLDGATEAVLGQLDALGIERCVLVGHSLGASVAVLLATRAGHRVESLVLMSPAGFWREPFARAQSRRFEVAFGVWRRGVLLGGGHVVKAPPMRHLALMAMMHRPLERISRREAEQLVAGAAQGRSTVQAREAVVAADLFGEAAALEQPVDLVWGRQDRITPFDTAERLADAIADVRTHFLDEVGHMVMFEDRDVVARAVESLVARRG